MYIYRKNPATHQGTAETTSHLHLQQGQLEEQQPMQTQPGLRARERCAAAARVRPERHKAVALRTRRGGPSARSLTC